ncbi:hypothetical protein G5I_07493 [Acromyrmex echinatior]|uniref:Uncharacterized protein n=1 Tax=Acromyrmex echinatior TaxID=103372 RepID=F4WNY3_ACREC|nr:hypothetical protein G5I_07493 [Acromyrmex echinatior]
MQNDGERKRAMAMLARSARPFVRKSRLMNVYNITIKSSNLHFYAKDDDVNEAAGGGRQLQLTVKVLKVALPGRIRKFVWRSSLSYINVSQRTQEVEICLRLRVYCRKKKLSNKSTTSPHSSWAITRAISFRTITNALDAEALAMDDIREAVNDENYKLNTEQFKR